jgi:fumarylpyruvate hydrolase
VSALRVVIPIPSLVTAAIDATVERYPVRRIFTGTPAGVTAVVPGDQVECHIEGLGTLSNRMVERQ